MSSNNKKHIIAIINSLLVVIVSLMLLKCAMQGFPSGGPVDKTPPQIAAVYPTSDSTGVDIYLKKITIIFSERMNTGTIPNNLFISPLLNYELEWSASDELSIIINDTLKNNQTYVITIGSAAQDEHSNKLQQSFQSAFSSGPQIDHGSIAGRVYGLETKESVNLFAYTLQDSIKIDFTKRKPDYIMQSGEKGLYKFDYLKSGLYRLFAVNDQNSNLLIEPNFEMYGIPYRDVLIDSSNMSFSGLGFLLSKSDTISPIIIGAKALNFHTIRVRLNKAINTPKINEMEIVDTLANKAIKILGITRSRDEDFFLKVFTDSLDKSSYYRVISHILKDSSGNINSVRQYSRTFPGSAKEDTTSLKLIKFTPNDSTINIAPDESIHLEFSRTMDWNTIYKSFQLQQNNGDSINGHWHHKNLYSADFIPSKKLLTDSSYIAQITIKNIRDLYGAALEDTIIRHKFTIISTQKLGEIAGDVTINQPQAPVILNFVTLKNKNRIYHLSLNFPGKFYKPFLPSGNYLIDAYLDVDKNGQYGYGKLSPFSYSEPFFFLQDTISVRARWETSDINIEIPFGEKSSHE
jgi:hypothetical protein